MKDSNESNVTPDKTKKQKQKKKPKQSTTKPALKPVATPVAALKLREEPEFAGYDIQLIDDFLDVVFHNHDHPTGNVMLWRVKRGKGPQYPCSEDELFTRLRSTPTPCALYYGTSTCSPDPTTNKLRNRKELFAELHVLVLDDIGTKVPVEKLPQDFKPTYIIETSKGNYQYGYVLDKPINELAPAEALVQLAYESGFSDEGGKMPTKLVRLPAGINGKQGVKGDFSCRLIHMDGPTYSPQQILDKMELGVDWADVLADADEVTKQRAKNSIGASPWSPVKPVAAALNGIIDPVLEWLYESEQVISDNGGDWVSVACPWSHEHTDGDAQAGYAPLGRGARLDHRGFNCFHGHCQANKTPEFLHHVATNGGPEAGVTDQAAILTAGWVYDSSSDSVWEVKDVPYPMAVTMTAFRNLFPQSVVVQDATGKSKRVKEHAMWLTSPSRVSVAGQAFAPYSTARIVPIDGREYMNTYAPPIWPTTPIDESHVQKFREFIQYLIPDEADAEYVLDWLAAKVQDMGFRGAGLLMIAKEQGVGRTTLTDMISVLLGTHNTENVPFEKIISGGEFNEWVEKPLVIADETLSTDKNEYYRGYEKLKSLLDPRPKVVTINPKYGRKRETQVHSSFIFLSNHADAVVLPEGDRRFYVLENAFTPAPPEYFTGLNAWLNVRGVNGKPEWAVHVWNWLLARPVDLAALLAPPAPTQAKQEMVRNTASPAKLAVNAVFKVWPSPYFYPKDVMRCLVVLSDQFELANNQNIRGVLGKLVKEGSGAFPRGVTTRSKAHDTPIRVRAISARLTPDDITHQPNKYATLPVPDKKRLRRELAKVFEKPVDYKNIIKQAMTILEGEGL